MNRPPKTHSSSILKGNILRTLGQPGGLRDWNTIYRTQSCFGIKNHCIAMVFDCAVLTVENKTFVLIKWMQQEIIWPSPTRGELLNIYSVFIHWEILKWRIKGTYIRVSCTKRLSDFVVKSYRCKMQTECMVGESRLDDRTQLHNDGVLKRDSSIWACGGPFKVKPLLQYFHMVLFI